MMDLEILVVDSVKNDGRPDSFVPTSANNEI